MSRQWRWWLAVGLLAIPVAAAAVGISLLVVNGWWRRRARQQRGHDLLRRRLAKLSVLAGLRGLAAAS